MGGVDLHSIGRAADSFQQPVTAAEIRALCRRSLGADVLVTAATEIGVGTYNSTYRLDLDRGAPVVLRIAPTPARQSPDDRDAMRNEYAAAPFLAPLGLLVPRILAADFTHQLIDRDYMVQTLVTGVPASTGLTAYPRSEWLPFYRQLGAITQTIHDVRGARFGPVAGPGHDTWSQALVSQFKALAADQVDAGLDPDGCRRIIDLARHHRAVLDDIPGPRLLHGDLWTLNLLIDAAAAEPTITGVLDSDRACWGDPLGDVPLDRVRHLAEAEQDAFFTGYGTPVSTAGTELREQFYRARHLIGSQLDIQRRGMDFAKIPAIHWDLTDVLLTLEGN